MATDDDRRSVAERLRRAWANVPDKNPVRHHMRVLYEIYAAVGLNDDGVDAIDLFDRLADLIDPGESGQNLDKNRDTVQIESPAVQKAPECDREALLALADKLECDGECDGCDMSDGIWCDAQGYAARRIREACGEAVRNG